MDFKGFSKVGLSKSGKTTVFKHKDGHFLHVAHDSLSNEHKKQLQELPLADGGPVPPVTPEGISKGFKKATGFANGTPDGTLPSVEEAMQPEVSGAKTGQDVGTASYDPDAAADVDPTPESKPSDGDAADVTPPSAAPQAVSPVRQDMNNEVQGYEQDLDSGKITPKHYSQLFGDSGTPGKIASLFGMMLGGIGSGLTHQPNAFMQMMDNVIDRDLKAQQESVGNKQNFLRIAQQNELNKANVGNVKQDTAAKAFALGQAHTYQSSFHDLVEDYKKTPDTSPLKQQKLNILTTVYPEVRGKINNFLDVGESASGIANDLPQPQPGQGGVNYNKFNALQRRTQMGVPGAPSESDLGNATKEAGNVEEVGALRSEFNKAYDALDTKFLAGKLSPHDRDSYINTLAGKLATASAGRYNAAESSAQLKGMLPEAGDWAATRADRRKNNEAFFNTMEANTPTLNRFGLKNEQQPQAETKTMHGAQYKKVPGGWQKVK